MGQLCPLHIFCAGLKSSWQSLSHVTAYLQWVDIVSSPPKIKGGGGLVFEIWQRAGHEKITQK